MTYTQNNLVCVHAGGTGVPAACLPLMEVVELKNNKLTSTTIQAAVIQGYVTSGQSQGQSPEHHQNVLLSPFAQYQHLLKVLELFLLTDERMLAVT